MAQPSHSPKGPLSIQMTDANVIQANAPIIHAAEAGMRPFTEPAFDSLRFHLRSHAVKGRANNVSSTVNIGRRKTTKMNEQMPIPRAGDKAHVSFFETLSERISALEKYPRRIMIRNARPSKGAAD